MAKSCELHQLKEINSSSPQIEYSTGASQIQIYAVGDIVLAWTQIEELKNHTESVQMKVIFWEGMWNHITMLFVTRRQSLFKGTDV